MLLAFMLAAALTPPVAPYAALGCTINATTDDFNHHWVRTHVWVKYESTEWKKLYSIREGDDPRKAMSECSAWMKQAKKLLKGDKK